MARRRYQNGWIFRRGKNWILRYREDVRTPNGEIARVQRSVVLGHLKGKREARNEGAKRLREINSGIYAFDRAPLFDALRSIGRANAQGEFYLPGLVRIYRERGLGVETVTLEDPRELQEYERASQRAFRAYARLASSLVAMARRPRASSAQAEHQ